MTDWKKYQDNPQVLRTLVGEMVALDKKICEAFDKRQHEILVQHNHGRGSLMGVPRKWGDKYWELEKERNQLIHPLAVDIAEIWETLAQFKNKS